MPQLRLLHRVAVARRSAAFLGAALGLLLTLPAAPPAAAHPHIWIINQTSVVFEDGKAVALRMSWSFDGFFRELIKEEFDKDKNGTLSAGEIADIEKNAFSNLKEYNYFTSAKMKGQEVAFATPEGFSAELRPKDVLYTFTLKLPRPASAHELEFSVRDETYYTDVAFDEADPVKLVGDLPGNCLASLAEDKKNPYYFGLVFPIVASISCTQS